MDFKGEWQLELSGGSWGVEGRESSIKKEAGWFPGVHGLSLEAKMDFAEQVGFTDTVRE